eukprot:6002123-Ditylum_brightwellii.AAC.1
MGSKQHNSNKAEPHNSDSSDKCYHYYKSSSQVNERKRGNTTFNVRAALLALLKSMATVDNTIYLETGKTKEV